MLDSPLLHSSWSVCRLAASRTLLSACLLLSLTACDESTGGDDATPATPAATTPTTTTTVPTLLNELKINIPDDAPVEYVELKGEPNATLKNTYLLIIDGDDDSDSGKDGYGKIEYVQSLDGVKVGTNGLVLIRRTSRRTRPTRIRSPARRPPRPS